MRRREFLKAMAGAATAAGVSQIGVREAWAAEPERPNIIVFLADDLGYGDLGCYGHPIIKTPHLDRFAEEGVKLTSCYSACAVCSPSRSAIQTGRTPHRNGVFTWIPADSEVHLRSSEITIARLLHDIGYATCHVGKWHLNGKFNSPEQPQPSDHGYDHWFATQNNAHPSHKNPDNFVRNGESVGELEGFSATLIAEEAIEWLRGRPDQADPFFLTVWTHEPHRPIESDPRFMAMYADLDDEGQVQHHANVTQIDDAFGMLMKTLEERGLADNTFVMFTSDNGPAGDGKSGRTRGSAGGLRGRKGTLYEGGIRVPGIVRWPGHVRRGSESDEAMVGTDIFTSICDITGIPVPGDRPIDGASMLPAFEGRPIERKIPLYWRWDGTGGPKMALRQGDYKLLAGSGVNAYQLHNLRDDRAETHNLVEEEPERFDAMRRELTRLNAEIEAEGPHWWEGYFEKRRAKSQPIEKGEDRTSSFDVAMGCTVTKSELGCKLDAPAEGFALKRAEEPITGRAVFRLKYQTLSKGGVKNGCLVFGADDSNDNLVKCGSLIGMSAHAIFQGTFSNNAQGVKRTVEFDKEKVFEATVTVDLKAGTVVMEIDGETLKGRLPEGLKEIRYYGCYAKGTQTAFGPITAELDG